jgi:phosphopantothenoylcysteine decarboxylase/phosphopantothenate--cysteine ligase
MRIDVETALEMEKAVHDALPADVAIMVAAVADWRPAAAAGSKMKKSSAQPPSIALVENPDILRTLSQPGPHRPTLVVGFAAETDDVIENATAKRLRKGCDWIVANDVSPETGIMGGTDNEVALITAAGAEQWPRMSKADVAARLAERVAEALR